MSTAIWISIALLVLGLVVWLIIRIRDWLWWRDTCRGIHLAGAASNEIEQIALTSSNPVEALAKVMQGSDESGYHKAYAAEHLVKIGTKEAAEVLCLALEDNDLFVRGQARRAMRLNDTLTNEFKEIIFDSVALGLKEADSSYATPEGHWPGVGCEDVIELLPKLDPARAAIELTNPSTLRVNHPNLYELIQRLTRMRVALDDSVFDWLAVLRPCVAEGRRDVTGRSAMVYGQLLRAAAFKAHPKTAEWIDDLFQNRELVPVWPALEGAAEAKAMLAGLSMDLREDIRQRVESNGLDGLSPAERHFAAVMDYSFHTELYGLGDYVLNSSMCDQALEGLAAMGENYVRPRLERALELRNLQNGSLDKTATEALVESIDSIPYPQDTSYQSLEMLAHLYAAANADAFQDKL